jgi:hypothetical protein
MFLSMDAISVPIALYRRANSGYAKSKVANDKGAALIAW